MATCTKVFEGYTATITFQLGTPAGTEAWPTIEIVLATGVENATLANGIARLGEQVIRTLDKEFRKRQEMLAQPYPDIPTIGVFVTPVWSDIAQS